MVVLLSVFTYIRSRGSTPSSIIAMAVLKIAVTQLVLVALFGVIGIDGKPPSAVMRGDSVYEHEFPHQVSLSIFGQHVCGGSIIDSRHILTAAHCVNDPYMTTFMTVIAGTNYLNAGAGDNYRIWNVIIHPGYFNSEHYSWKNDIAIITLSSPIKFDERHGPVKLPKSNTPADIRVTACGWGDTSYPNGNPSIGLKKLSMVVIPNKKCVLPGVGDIHETHLCAYSRMGAGLCSGDSGGPLLDGDTLVGVASFVIPCGKGYPDVFTRVYSYVDWINEVMEKH